jgi:hypothetical protein
MRDREDEKRSINPILVGNMMTRDNKQDEHTLNEIERYRVQIPRQLWNILLPREGESPHAFAVAIKRLRIREQERNYVMSIQRKFRIPVRPNETVKESMTRVRLKRLHDLSGDENRRGRDNLPSDPLE